METKGPDVVLARHCASLIVGAFARYNADFRKLSRRAPERFENRDWAGVQSDVVERLDLYGASINAVLVELEAALGARSQDVDLWHSIKAAFAGAIESLPDPEFLKTYFSSITRRLFNTTGVSDEIEFFALDLDPLRDITSHVVTNTYANRGSLELLFEELLSDFRFHTPWRARRPSWCHR